MSLYGSGQSRSVAASAVTPGVEPIEEVSRSCSSSALLLAAAEMGPQMLAHAWNVFTGGLES